MTFVRTLLLGAALGVQLLSAQSWARAAAPSSISANYDVTFNGLQIGVTREQFNAGDQNYRIVSESTAVGLLALFRKDTATLMSSGRLLSSGLQPDLFEGRNNDDETRRVSATFDWTGQRLTLSHDGTTETMPLPALTQDRISLMYQFMFVAFDGLGHLDVAMTNGRKLDEYRYLITPDVDIDTPLGRMKTLHLVKQRQPGESTVEVWLAPQHHFFPVKVLIIEKDGSRYEQVITKLELGPQPQEP
jgi:hypothetical protein